MDHELHDQMYHSHHDATEQVGLGMLGPLIVVPKERNVDPSYDKDEPFILNDALGGFTINGKGFPATAPYTARPDVRRREFLVALAGAALAACAAPAVARPPAPTANSLLAMPLHSMWPGRYAQAPQTFREAYAFAVDHKAQLRYIPCFCGCGPGHRDNWDCFVKEETAPGTFILDPHGFACGSCVGVALDTKAMLASGMSLKAIRTAIDAKWTETGPATPTPYPDE